MVYKLPFSSTKISKIIIFQFKLLHRRLATNDFLNKIGIRPEMIFVLFVEMRENLLSIFSGLVGRLIFSGKTFKIG